jgi:hypothetical protein
MREDISRRVGADPCRLLSPLTLDALLSFAQDLVLSPVEVSQALNRLPLIAVSACHHEMMDQKG